MNSGDANGNFRTTCLNCMECTVHLGTYDKEWYRILNDMDGTA